MEDVAAGAGRTDGATSASRAPDWRTVRAVIVPDKMRGTATADQVARLTGSSTKRRNAAMPRNAISRMATVVRRGSQSHHTPHVGLAQMAPWTDSRKQSTTDISMAASSR